MLLHLIEIVSCAMSKVQLLFLEENRKNWLEVRNYGPQVALYFLQQQLWLP